MNNIDQSRLLVLATGVPSLLVTWLTDIEPVLKSIVLILNILLAGRHCWHHWRPKRAPRRSQSTLPVLTLSAVLALVCTGCTILSSTTYDPATGHITTRVRALALFDTQTALQRFANRSESVTNGFAPGTYIGGYDSRTSVDTNVYEALGTILGTALKTAK